MSITRNEGNLDRILRVILAFVLFGAALLTQTWFLAIIGLIPLFTGLVGWCPLYSLFGLSTCPAKS